MSLLYSWCLVFISVLFWLVVLYLYINFYFKWKMG